MPKPIVGLHHVTAIASDPQRNLDFYTEVLGLRFVKRTINFDDPGTYHFYFGDDAGSPGTILTFFPWPGAVRAHAGDEVARTAFSVPAASLEYWHQRLTDQGLLDRKSTRLPSYLLTFFPWPGAVRAHAGDEVARTAFSVPAASLEYWHQRLTDQGL